MDRYWKEVLQVSTRKHGINVQYLYDKQSKKATECNQNAKKEFFKNKTKTILKFKFLLAFVFFLRFDHLFDSFNI